MSRNAVLFWGFIVILALPAVDHFTGTTNKLFPSTDNRRLAEMPESSILEGTKFVEEFDQYYQDNFGLRNMLIRGFSLYKYRFFGVSPLPSKVVVGKDGWLFGGNFWNNVIDETTGKDLFSRKELSQIAQNIKLRQKRYREKGMAYYVMVVPNKHTVYPEYLPAGLSRYKGPTKLDQVKRYLSENADFNIIDLRESFDYAKSQFPIYYSADTHWNFRGAFVGYRQLIQRLQIDFPHIPMLEWNELVVGKTSQQGDLARMLNLPLEMNDVQLLPPNKYHCLDLRKQLELPPYYAHQPGSFEFRFSCNTQGKPTKLLFYRDSFGLLLSSYLKHSFSESVFVWSYVDPYYVALSESPDIVISEIGERSLDKLLNQN